MKHYRAGEDVVSHCGRCKMDLMHVIHAEVEGTPARVECKTCGAVHGYRAPKGGGRGTSSKAAPRPRAASSSGAAGSAAAKSSTRSTSRKVSGPSPADLFNQAIEGVDLSEPRAYKMSERYEDGEVIDHMTFGTGLILRVHNEQKLEAIFEVGTKLLVHNKR